MSAVPNLIRAAGNEFVTTLASSVSNVDTTMQLSSVTGLNTGGGVLIIDEATASEERVYYESIAGNIITIATSGRGLYGTSAVAHASGVTVTDVLVDAHVNNMRTEFLIGHNDDGTHKDNSDTQTLTNKTLTAPKLNENVALTSTATELNNLHNKTLNFDAWTAFNITLNNLTLGNGSRSAAYNTIGKTHKIRFTITLGSTSVVAGALSLNFPVAISSGYNALAPIGNGGVYDASGTIVYPLTIRADGTIGALPTGGTYETIVDTSATVPITFATGDILMFNFSVEIA